MTAAEMTQPILSVRDLKMYFAVTRGLLRRKVADVKAVDGVSFDLARGETLGLVGESGCGKTTTGRCVLRLYEPTEGSILFEGEDIARMPERKIRPLRRKMGTVFQDPFSSLDPRQTAGSIVGEGLRIHGMCASKQEYRDRVAELFTMVELDPGMADRVPHEFSGGQRQRLSIARALACNPSLVICDEPISALDVSIQAQIVNLLEGLQASMGLAYLFIAHDLAAVCHISRRVAVMYLGRIVEIASSEDIQRDPLHPYTKALLSAVPTADPYVEEKRQRVLLEGETPSALNPPSGCPFHTRCSRAVPECRTTVPGLREVKPGHEVACIRVGD
jgi:peptide/nickel transport system ATP-binding protein